MLVYTVDLSVDRFMAAFQSLTVHYENKPFYAKKKNFLPLYQKNNSISDPKTTCNGL